MEKEREWLESKNKRERNLICAYNSIITDNLASQILCLFVIILED